MHSEQDFTAERKTALVLDILAGTTSVSDAAAQYGVDATQIEEWKELYLVAARTTVTGRSRATSRVGGRVRHLAFLAAAVLLAGATLFGSVGVLLAATPCVNLGNTELCIFTPGTPAVASEINANFSKLRAWLEGKVGGVGTPGVAVNGDLSVSGNVTTPNISAGSATVAGSASVAGNAAISGNLAVNGRITAKHTALCDCVDYGNWTLFQDSRMYQCPEDKVMAGIYSTGGPNPACGQGSNACLEWFRCCRVCSFAPM